MTNLHPSEPLIVFKDVRIGFDEGNVLDGISFQVSSGETKVLLGESGSGKTLIMKLAAGLMSADSGQILVTGPGSDRNERERASRLSAPHRIRISGERAVRFAHGRGERCFSAARR